MRKNYQVTKHRGFYKAVELKTGRTYRRPVSKPGEWLEVVNWPEKVEKLEAAVTAHETPQAFTVPTIDHSRSGPRPPVMPPNRTSQKRSREWRGEGNRYE